MTGTGGFHDPGTVGRSKNKENVTSSKKNKLHQSKNKQIKNENDGHGNYRQVFLVK